MRNSGGFSVSACCSTHAGQTRPHSSSHATFWVYNSLHDLQTKLPRRTYAVQFALSLESIVAVDRSMRSVILDFQLQSVTGSLPEAVKPAAILFFSASCMAIILSFDVASALVAEALRRDVYSAAGRVGLRSLHERCT